MPATRTLKRSSMYCESDDDDDDLYGPLSSRHILTNLVYDIDVNADINRLVFGTDNDDSPLAGNRTGVPPGGSADTR